MIFLPIIGTNYLPDYEEMLQIGTVEY